MHIICVTNSINFIQIIKYFSESIDNDLKQHRLYIVEAFYITILKVFECLGIEPVAEM